MEWFTAITTILTVIVAAVSAIVAAVELYRSKKVQERVGELNKKNLTIESFNRLQEQAIDHLVVCSKAEIEATVEDIDEQECKEAYEHYRAYIAKIEHFAVGVNEDIYDFETVNKLAGAYLIRLFYNVKSVIDKTREEDRDGLMYYTEFEKLKGRLEESNKDIVVYLED